MSDKINLNIGIERRSHFINSNDNNFTYYENNAPSHKKREIVLTLLYFPISILFMELVVKLSVGFSLVDGALFTAIFSLVPACVLTVVSSIFKNGRVNRLIACILTAVLAIWYSAQIVYNNVFGTFFVINSISRGGAGQALNSVDMIFTALKSRIFFYSSYVFAACVLHYFR